MPNTSLPTNLVPGSAGHIDHTNTVHDEVNRLSRETGNHDIDSYLVNGWTAQVARIRRSGDIATLSVRNLTGGSDPTFLNLVASAPGVSTAFVGGGLSRRSPLFETADGGQFYFVITSNTIRVFFLNGLTNTGGFQADWVIPNAGSWPAFMP